DELSPQYEGPYTFYRPNTGGAYEIHDGASEPLGRNYIPSQLKLIFDDLDGADVYIVEKIVSRCSTSDEKR
ncbi:hypothetical protein BGZ49_003998, partial [Haplosporangium sp. Z 27]